MKETGKSYDRFSRVREADARAAALDKGFESSDTDADRYVELADAFAKFARELKTAVRVRRNSRSRSCGR